MSRPRTPARIAIACRSTAIALLGAALASCGGGGASSVPPPPPPPPPPVTSLAAVQLSAESPFVPGCDGSVPSGVQYRNAEVEPSAAVNPINPANVLTAWQQDRWSDGGAAGIVTAASFDSGRTWARAVPRVARCSGGSATNGLGFERVTDPWLTFAADGTAYLLSLSFTGTTFAAGSTSAMLVLRSTNGGLTWGAATPLIQDGAAFFNDKGSIAADATDARSLYAVWDRIDATNSGPTYFARTQDGGASWEAARLIYDPGAQNQTIGNLLLSLPGGVLLLVFTELDTTPTATTGTLKAMRSDDRGASWDSPVAISSEASAGIRDPATGLAVRDGSDIPAAAVDRSGTVYVVWQDSRFSAGQRDGIALSRSSDAGRTWTSPVRVNGSAATPAFTPNVTVRADGVIGVTYYDLRNNMPAAGDFKADYWLATSIDGVSWSDTHVSGPFPLGDAPNSEGLFLGDYQSLASSGGEFLPVFATSNPDPANPTDVRIAFGRP